MRTVAGSLAASLPVPAAAPRARLTSAMHSWLQYIPLEVLTAHCMQMFLPHTAHL